MRAREVQGRWRHTLAWLALVAGLACPATAQESSASLEGQVEAAFLVNFLRYTDWPPERVAPADEPLVITVIGDDAMAATLARLTRVVPPVRGHRIEVQRLEFPDGADATVRTALSERLRRSHLVFVRETRQPLDAVLGDLSGQPVLTVSDRPGFAADGGMLGLRRRDGRIVFEANPGAIRNARLVVSAKVLKLARIVDGAVR
ncbi:MAG: YfiR family protein [Arenimonas sp.]